MEMKLADQLNSEKVEENSARLVIDQYDFIHYDFSKTHCSESDKAVIKQKLNEANLNGKIEDLWAGKNVNFTENRPVLHYLLREKSVLNEVRERLMGKDATVKRPKTEGNNIISQAKAEIVEELLKISSFTENLKNSSGITGKPFDTVVNIGIGGSDLGPRFVTEALQYYKGKHINNVHFISNVDPTDAIKTFKQIDVEKTLFIIVSKTFTTVETMENFKLALGLFRAKTQSQYNDQEICNKHFVAVSSNLEETSKYGIQTVFKMWDFVGGRYSLWSAVGLSIALYIGFDNYMKLLSGASAADEDFYANKMDSISTRLAINELFYISKGFNNKCIVCYDSYLSLMYKYLQQAEMESNGKANSKQMIIWGGVGTDVQHSFFQLLHQGEQDIYLELLCPIYNISLDELCNDTEVLEQAKKHQKLLISSCIAQSQSMAFGKESNDINHHFRGNKPSVTILYSKLTPETLGAMMAIYEHKIYVEGIYFNINSFDQFGVTLGKKIAIELAKELEADKISDSLDASTYSLLSIIKKK